MSEDTDLSKIKEQIKKIGQIKVQGDFIATSVSLESTLINNQQQIHFRAEEWRTLLSDIQVLEAYAQHPGLERMGASYKAHGTLTRTIEVRKRGSQRSYRVTDYVDGNERGSTIYTSEDMEDLFYGSRL